MPLRQRPSSPFACPSFKITSFSRIPADFPIPIMLSWRLFLLFPLLCLSLAEETPASHALPRPLIIEYPASPKEVDEGQVSLQCDSWRFAVEANNVNPWKTIPQECADYVRDYLLGKAYGFDLDRVSNEAEVFAGSVELGGDGKDAWIFDIDETLLSNLPYYAEHGFGLEVFDPVEFDKWVDKAEAQGIQPSLKLYEQVLGLGFKVFLLTGRSENQRSVTVENLINAGFRNWDKLVLRASDDHAKRAVVYKSEKRDEMVREGYRILGNSGDQWSDLLGSSMSIRSFKLPNPMYYIP